jgi:hypothetical protein
VIRARRLVLPLVVVPLMALVVVLSVLLPQAQADLAQAPGTTVPRSAGAGAGDPLLTITGQSGWVAPNGTFQIQLETGAVPEGSKIVARLYSPVTTSAQLQSTGRGEGLGSPIQPSVAVALGEAPRDAAGQLSLSYPIVSTGDLPPYGFRVGPYGVYPMSFGILGPDGQESGRTMTHLIHLQPLSAGRAPLAVGLVVPFHAAVAHQPTGEVTLDPAEAADLEGLTGELNRRPAVPLTVAPTPETLDAMTEYYRTTGVKQPAKSLADAVRTGRQVVNGTYVGVDEGAWVAQGLASALNDQFQAGADSLQAQLGAPPDRSTLVVDATTTPEVLGQQLQQGPLQAVVPSDLLQPLSGRSTNETPTQTFDLISSTETRLPAVASDSALSQRLTEGDNPTLAAHEVLADLALRSFPGAVTQPCNLPSGDATACRRGLALTLPAAAGRSRSALAVFLDAFADRDGTGTGSATNPGNPLVVPTTVNELMLVVDRASASFRTRSGAGAVLTRELVGGPTASLGSYPSDLQTTDRAIAGYRSMTSTAEPKGSAIASSIEQVGLSSGAVEFDAATRTAYLDGARALVDAQTTSVRAPSQVTITLTSSQAHIPMTVENALDYPVRVTLHFSSAKLEFPNGDAEQTIDLPPNQPTRIEIAVRTRASGSFPMEVTTTSPNRSITIATTRFTVRSTAVSGVGLALTIVAGLFLVLWWGRHFRNARRAKRLIGSRHPVLGAEPEASG